MMKILFLILLIFVSNFFEVDIPYGLDGLLKRGNNEYIAIYDHVYSSYTYEIKVEYENITVVDTKYFSRANYGDDIFDVLIIDNNLIFYGLMFQVLVENNLKTNEVVWGGYFLDMIRFVTQDFSNDCLLICTWTYNFTLDHYYGRYDFQLHLLKAPYIEISKELDIQTFADSFNIKLIGLKNYFVYIKLDESDEYSGNITYKILDFDLNIVDSLTEEYTNYVKLYFFKLSNSGKVNEFMRCVLKIEDRSEYLDIYKCQVIKYQNKELSIIQTIDIPIYGLQYSLKTYFFDENKFVFYFYDIYESYKDYINILQYENHVLSFYKNFNNLTLPKLVHYYGFAYYFQADFAMTEQGVALIFKYLSSICVPKTITL